MTIEEILEQAEVKAGSINTFDEFRNIQAYKERELFLEDVDEEACNIFVRLIIEYNKMDEHIEKEKRKPIKIFINSCGGGMVEAYAIVDAIQLSETPVHTICVGSAYSAGGVILIAGHRRVIYPRGSFMFHEGSSGMSGDAGKVKDNMVFYECQLEKLKSFICEKTKISPETYELRKRDDWYMTAEKALEHGIVDEIATKLY